MKINRLVVLSSVCMLAFLASCTPTGNSSTSSTSDTSNSVETSSSSEASSSISASIPSSIATGSSFINSLSTITDSDLSAINYTYTNHDGSETTFAATLNTNEVLVTTNNVTSDYYACFGDVYYDATRLDAAYPKIVRNKIVETTSTYDETTSDTVEEKFDTLFNRYSLDYLFEYDIFTFLIWADIDNVAASSYSVNAIDSGYTILFEGYYENETTDAYAYKFNLSLDSELCISSGTFEKNYYYASEWDFENHTAQEDTSPVHTTLVINSVDYSEKVTVEESKKAFDLTPYFTTSVSGVEYYNPDIYGAGSGSTIYVGDNLTGLGLLFDNATIAPETALDYSSAYITSVSDESIVALNSSDGYYYALKAGDVTLTYGNAFVKNLFTLDLTITAKEEKAVSTTPTLSTGLSFWNIDQTGFSVTYPESDDGAIHYDITLTSGYSTDDVICYQNNAVAYDYTLINIDPVGTPTSEATLAVNTTGSATSMLSDDPCILFSMRAGTTLGTSVFSLYVEGDTYDDVPVKLQVSITTVA